MLSRASLIAAIMITSLGLMRSPVIAIAADGPAILAPKALQVIQRQGFPAGVNTALPEYPLGYADVRVVVSGVPAVAGEGWEAAIQPASATETNPPESSGVTFQSAVAVDRTSAGATVTVRLPAGGWYLLVVRQRVGDQTLAKTSITPIGIGEVFLVAGQSYSTNCNDEQLMVNDPAKRVSAWNHQAAGWQVANDPQPCLDGSSGGSIWPPFGDALAQSLNVPIGFVNVGIGATATSQWLPGTPFFNNLVAAGQRLGQFRAVLWQQGESDVLAKTTTAQYIENLKLIQQTSGAAWQTQPPWFLAKSTHHPTVYNDPVGEGAIRAADDALAAMPGFRMGPDTDTLQNENRGPLGSYRHFTGLGQRNAAKMWVTSVSPYLNRVGLEYPIANAVLADCHLWEPAWLSPIVWNESSVLFQEDGQPTAIANLGYAAKRIISVRVAATHQPLQEGRDFQLSADGLSLLFVLPAAVPAILRSELFLPANAPHSYRHRAGNPDQYLLYRPGRWFHDHDVEVTYERLSGASQPFIAQMVQRLPKTMARLKSRQPLKIGVSGDSISTGADASAIARTFPNQPGFPDLVTAQLQATFDTDVSLVNRAVGGWGVDNGISDLPKLLAERPDLVIVAYGMNNVGGRNPGAFANSTGQIVKQIQVELPEAEIILVATMLGNKDWVHTPPEMFAAYRDELQKLTGPGIALADLTAVWADIEQHKHHFDMTGNGLNHPNDFGHRLYAQCILQLLKASE